MMIVEVMVDMKGNEGGLVTGRGHSDLSSIGCPSCECPAVVAVDVNVACVLQPQLVL
jgi:hypothetical protein